MAGGLDQRGQGCPAGVARNGGILDIFQSHHWQDLLRDWTWFVMNLIYNVRIMLYN